MFENKILNKLAEDYYDKYLDELNVFDQEFNKEVSEEEFEFGDNVFSFLQELIDTDNLTEEFSNQNQLTVHFRRHCLRNISGRVSTRSSVYYDFVDEQDYSKHEEDVSNKAINTMENTDMFISDLYDTEKLIKAFRKLFEGNKTLVFSLACGFHNNIGPIRLCLNAYATRYTSNYQQNTIDFLIQAPNNKTVTLYAIDANYLENKINSEIARIPESILININH